MEMSAEQWERVKDLYESALECDRSHRDDFLDRNGADDFVREEVRRLLKEHENLGNFLSTSPFARHWSGDDVQEQNRFEPGELVAERFRIVRFIAAGGMGEVYEAQDLVLDENLAIKTIRPRILQQDNALERFKREVHLARKVTHPNICRVFDLFWHHTAGDDPESVVAFVSMELLQGETLAERIHRAGRLTPDEALPLVDQIAAGLEAAHRAGIVHRDLKPGNVMLVPGNEDDEIRSVITDFGLAFRSGIDPTRNAELTATTGIFGTPAYMAPEQIEGKEVTKLSDIYALGLILYQMVTGEHAFHADTPLASAAKRLASPPPSPKRLAPELSDAWEETILRCLQRNPDDRYPRATAVAKALSAQAPDGAVDTSGLASRDTLSLWQRCKRPRIGIPLLLFLLVLGSVSGWWLHRSSRERWARYAALPRIAALINNNRVYMDDTQVSEAYALAVQAERYIPDDPMLNGFLDDISWLGSIKSTPPGVSVFRRPYGASDRQWEFIGRTPIEKLRLPAIDLEWSFELNGFKPVRRASFSESPITVTMDREGEAPPGMVRVEFPETDSAQIKPVSLRGLPGYEDLPAIPIGNFWIDKYEVTNRQFKKFVDAGGYDKPEYWKHEFRKDGRTLSWSDAMAEFRDGTGRRGPATWVLGEYPKGEEDFPVTGVSWYEAAAYAEFAGTSLPTVYHWASAAAPTDSASIVPLSNFSGKGAAHVGSYRGMSWTGAYDMAGNVKEWTLNEDASGKHYIMGGAWNEPTYLFNDIDARLPFERSANFGFRCAKYELTAEVAKASEPLQRKARDFSREKPVSDQVFRAYTRLYSYDKTPLHAVIEATEKTEIWERQKITFDAAYGNERITAYLFLPLKASPPYQTVVYFPGAGAIHVHSIADEMQFEYFDFIVKSGRALLFPVYKGTYERWDSMNNSYPNKTSLYRDHVIAWSKDLGRSIDYLETRPDIDSTKLAYEGFSWGAAMGSILPAVEHRLKLAVLIAPGFFLQECSPEVDQFNFAPRVKIPALMLNGRSDFIYPPQTSQEPMFRSLGTPREQKNRIVYDTVHNVPQNEMIKETLNWLDRYLGPVK